MVGGTQHHDRATLGQRDDQTGRPGHAVGMNDDRLNIVERYPPLFLTIKAGDKKSAISGKMEIIRGDINNTINGRPYGSTSRHIIDNDGLTWDRNKNKAKFIHPDLTGLSLLQNTGLGKERYERIYK